MRLHLCQQHENARFRVQRDSPPEGKSHFCEARVVTTYGNAADGEVVLLAGSAGEWEIAVVGGSAAERLGIELGDRIEFRRENVETEPEG